MASDDPSPTAFDEFLDRLIRGEAVDPDAFLASHPDLPQGDHDLLRRLCPGSDGGGRSPEPEETPGALRAPDSPPVERVGTFRLGKRIGVGGMGAVFLADDESLGRRVAVKLLGPDLVGTGERDERFQREIRAAARLRHPNIVTVHAAGEEHGVRWLAMEFVPGSSLQEVLADSTARGTRPPVGDVLRWGIGIARALHEAHEAGIIHRDVKPSNIRIAPDGHPVLLDFGLARDAGAATLTESGAFHGSPQYASPEQVGLGGTPIDRRTDVYSLGATLYEALTGVSPMRGETREQLFHHVLMREPLPLRRLDPSIPKDLETVILATQEKDPRRRHQTAEALAEDLEAVRDGRPVSVRPVSRLGRVARWATRQPAKAALAAALIVAVPLVAALGGYIAANLPRIKRASDAEDRSRLDALLEDGFLEFGEGDPERAQALFQQAIARDTSSREAMAGYALTRSTQRDYAGTIAFLDRCGAANEYWSKQIRIDALMGLHQEAEAKALAAATEPPRRAIDDFVVGVIRLGNFHSGQKKAAVDAFRHLRRAVLAANPPKALYHFELGHAAWHAGRHEDAREIARAIEQAWPESPERWFAVGRTLIDANPAAATDAFLKASDPLPRAQHAREMITIHLAESGRGPEFVARALAIAREGVALDPSRARSHALLGLVLVQAHEPEVAIRELEEAIRLKPDYEEAQRKLAEVYVLRERPADALAPAREAARLDPQDARAWNALGVALISLGKTEEAGSDFEQGLKIEPDNPELLCNWGRALMRQGEFARAFDALKRGDAIGSKRPKWGYDSKSWTADAAQRVSLEKRLEEIRRGAGAKPGGPELVRIARLVCRPKKRFAEASCLYARAFDVAPEIMAQPDPDYLREAAAVSIAAGLGEGTDAPAGPAERTELRTRARTWFEQFLRALEEQAHEAESRPESLAPLAKAWTVDPALAPVRAAGAAALPADEWRTWQDLWKRCGTLAEGR